MNDDVKREINGIIAELEKISSELYSVADGVDKEFKGIGANICASRLRSLSRQYVKVREELGKIK